jgi:hypothetical protein
MPNTGLIHESKAFLSSWLRSLEIKNAGGNAQELQKIAETSDDDTIRKWLWTATVYGVPTIFIAAPIALLVMSIVFTAWIMELFWLVEKIAMFAMLIIFGSAIFFTFISPKSPS